MSIRLWRAAVFRRQNGDVSDAGLEKALFSNKDSFFAEIITRELAIECCGGDAGGSGTHKGIYNQFSRLSALTNECFSDLRGLFCGIAFVYTRCGNDVGGTQVVELTFAFLKEENKLVPRPIVIAQSDLHLVPNQRLPEAKTCMFGERFGEEHCFVVKKKIKMSVVLQYAIEFTKKVGEASVGENLKPVVA